MTSNGRERTLRRPARPHIATMFGDIFESVIANLHRQLEAAGYGDVRPVHGAVFVTIGEAGARVADMARRAQITKQAMSELVEYLEERGYVERAPDPADGRAQIVRLSRKGRKSLEIAWKSFADYERSWSKHLGAAGAKQLRRLLEQLHESLEPDWSQRAVRVSVQSREHEMPPSRRARS